MRKLIKYTVGLPILLAFSVMFLMVAGILYVISSDGDYNMPLNDFKGMWTK